MPMPMSMPMPMPIPRHDQKTAYEKKTQKTKRVSNDRSGHDDSNGPRIVKIGAILAIFEHFKVFGQGPPSRTPDGGGEGGGGTLDAVAQAAPGDHILHS